MSEWREVYLNEAYSICSGISKPAKDFGSGFPFLSFKDVFNNFFIPEKLSELVESTDKERETFSIKRGDVFLTRTSETVKELGMSCVALKDYENATFNGFTKRLRPNKNFVIVPEYAGYYFRTSRFRNEVTAMSSASTRASLNNEMLERLKIILPSEKEQKQIADILSCLDNKIDNLRRQNETLEKIAQTLFKHWFIDFEFPNDDGKPYKSSGGAMVASELGDIPAGWRVGKLADVVDVFTGYPFKSDLYSLENGIKVVRGENVSLGFLRWDMEKRWEHSLENYQSYLLNSNDYIIGMDGSRVGKNRCIVFESDLPLLLAQRVARLRALKHYFQSYINVFLMQARFERYVDFIKTGTSIPHISGKQIKDFECLIPSEKTVSNFDDFYNRWFFKFDNNKKQIQTLTKTRDTLLPKLMSGQIRVKEGESIIEEE